MPESAAGLPAAWGTWPTKTAGNPWLPVFPPAGRTARQSPWWDSGFPLHPVPFSGHISTVGQRKECDRFPSVISR